MHSHSNPSYKTRTAFPKWEWLLVALVLVLAYFPLIQRIDVPTIALWDESRNVANALEMIDNGNLITRHFNGKPDMWELKPPFVIWLQSASIKIFGYNELAVRVPSAIFSMLTVILLLVISLKITGRFIAGGIASLVLMSSMGYVGQHVARTGDHDVFLCFFTTLTLFLWFQFLQTENWKWFWYAVLSLFFVWFTKSVAGLVFIPSLIGWAVYQKKFVWILKSKKTWLGLGLLTITIGLYYILREQQAPGYIKALWNEELFGRYLNHNQNISSQESPILYYIKRFVEIRFSYFIFPLVALVVLMLLLRKLKHRKFELFLFIQIAWFLLIISLGSKNFWYDAPLYPLFALCLGFILNDLIELIKPIWLKCIPALLFLIYCYFPYSETVDYSFEKNDPNNEISNMSLYLRDSKFPPNSNLKLVPSAFETPLFLYQRKLQENKIKTTICYPFQLKTNDTICVVNHAILDSLSHTYDFIYLDSSQKCKLLVLALKHQKTN